MLNDKKLNFKKYTLGFTLISPFMTGTNVAASFGVDDNLPLNFEDKPVIPGTLIRGVLHDVLHSLGKTDLLEVFGAESKRELTQNKNDDFDATSPVNSKIIFTDCVGLKSVEKNNNTLTRIAIDDETGSVKKGALQVIELPYAVDEKVEFECDVYLEEKYSNQINDFAKALNLVPSLGAFKSAGFGRVEDFKFTASPITPPTDICVKQGESHRFTLTINHPFLVNAERVADNVFRGSEYISGGAIKGAIARIFGTTSVEGITIKSAKPIFDGKKQSPLAFSHVHYGFKVDEMQDEDILEHKAREDALPTFQLDWKDKERNAINEKLKQEFHARESRTRTAIDYNTNAAKDEKVFVYDMVVPQGKNNTWEFEIFTKNRVFIKQLHNQTIFIGKMDTPATLTYKCEAIQPETHSNIILKLETDCLMFDETVAELKTAYETYFKTCFGDDLVLVEFYARQKMAGGWQALRARRSKKDNYYPFILTEAGSVFHLKNVDAGKLQTALKTGLPPFVEDFAMNPFSNQNGFGEISIKEAQNVA